MESLAAENQQRQDQQQEQHTDRHSWRQRAGANKPKLEPCGCFARIEPLITSRAPDRGALLEQLSLSLSLWLARCTSRRQVFHPDWNGIYRLGKTAEADDDEEEESKQEGVTTRREQTPPGAARLSLRVAVGLPAC